jgi:hypothetical protein
MEIRSLSVLNVILLALLVKTMVRLEITKSVSLATKRLIHSYSQGRKNVTQSVVEVFMKLSLSTFPRAKNTRRPVMSVKNHALIALATESIARLVIPKVMLPDCLLSMPRKILLVRSSPQLEEPAYQNVLSVISLMKLTQLITNVLHALPLVPPARRQQLHVYLAMVHQMLSGILCIL